MCCQKQTQPRKLLPMKGSSVRGMAWNRGMMYRLGSWCQSADKLQTCWSLWPFQYPQWYDAFALWHTHRHAFTFYTQRTSSRSCSGLSPQNAICCVVANASTCQPCCCCCGERQHQWSNFARPCLQPAPCVLRRRRTLLRGSRTCSWTWVQLQALQLQFC